jgi:hypothetical protein
VSSGITVSDNFTRANEAPLANGTWGSIFTQGLAIVSNIAHGAATGTESFSAWLTSSRTFTNKQSSEITLTTIGNFDNAGAAVLATTTGSGRGYVAVYENDAPRVAVYKAASGTATSLLTSISGAFVATDKLKIAVDASGGSSAVLTIYKNGARIGTVTDSSSPYTSGQPGVYYNRGNSNVTGITLWTGLEISPTGTPISGATSSSYTTGTVSAANNGTVYSVDCTNTNGTTTSASVYLFILGQSNADGDKINSAWFR